MAWKNKGRIKEFYERISNILRHYIEHRFDLHAPERTTEEFLYELNQLPVNEQDYTRCNSSHAFLHKTAVEYLQKTIVFNEEHRK